VKLLTEKRKERPTNALLGKTKVSNVTNNDDVTSQAQTKRNKVCEKSTSRGTSYVLRQLQTTGSDWLSKV